jgi:TetR/AcrR family transcriptional regulator, transcriptional repressor for nem operon
MLPAAKNVRNPAETRRKLVDATVRLIQRQGFAATTVDQICAEAGLTKGSFFHYFENKEAVGHAAVDGFAAMGTALYDAVRKDPCVDPLERIHQHFEIMIEMARQPGNPMVCVIGMLSQEMAGTHPSLRDTCSGHLGAWTDRVATMLTDAKKAHPPRIDFDPESVAWMLNSLWQGSMLIAKTRQSPDMIVSNVQHGRAYVDSLFGVSSSDTGRAVHAPSKRTRTRKKRAT